MINDPIADLLTRIRNASKVKHPSVLIPNSNLKLKVLEVLMNQGYVDSFKTVDLVGGGKGIKVILKCGRGGVPAIKSLSRLSKPGRRVYVKSEKIPKYKGGLGTVIVSTSKGVMTDVEARKQGIGGELVCSVF